MTVRFDANIDLRGLITVRAEAGDRANDRHRVETGGFQGAQQFRPRRQRDGGLQRHAEQYRHRTSDKIECFCFTEQTLKPGEKRRDAA